MPTPCEWPPGQGWRSHRAATARRGVLDAAAASWTIGAKEDGCAVSVFNDDEPVRSCGPLMDVARRAAGGRPNAEPAACAGPAVPRSGAALITSTALFSSTSRLFVPKPSGGASYQRCVMYGPANDRTAQRSMSPLIILSRRKRQNERNNEICTCLRWRSARNRWPPVGQLSYLGRRHGTGVIIMRDIHKSGTLDDYESLCRREMITPRWARSRRPPAAPRARRGNDETLLPVAAGGPGVE